MKKRMITPCSIRRSWRLTTRSIRPISPPILCLISSLHSNFHAKTLPIQVPAVSTPSKTRQDKITQPNQQPEPTPPKNHNYTQVVKVALTNLLPAKISLAPCLRFLLRHLRTPFLLLLFLQIEDARPSLLRAHVYHG